MRDKTIQRPPERPRYRLSWNGFRVAYPTQDDPLQFDGKGDEVYFTAAVFVVRDGAGVPAPRIVESPVFGDSNGQPGRITAGLLSADGGLAQGDSYPDNPDRIRSPADGEALPLVLFEAEFVAPSDFVVVVPALWERDRSRAAYDAWHGWVQGDLRDYLVRERMAYETCEPGLTAPVGNYGAVYDGDTVNEFDRPVGFRPEVVPESEFVVHSAALPDLGRRRAYFFDPCLYLASGGAPQLLHVELLGRAEQYTLYFQLERLN